MTTNATTLENIFDEPEAYDLWDDTSDEQFPSIEEDGESINSITRQLHRQEQRRQKRPRDYADTLRVNAIRHAIEYNDGKRKREKALLRNVLRYTSGGFEIDMA